MSAVVRPSSEFDESSVSGALPCIWLSVRGSVASQVRDHQFSFVQGLAVGCEESGGESLARGCVSKNVDSAVSSRDLFEM